MENSSSKIRFFVAGLITVGVFVTLAVLIVALLLFKQEPVRWQFQSIDTMKYSRDLAREKLNDFSFDRVIEKQVKDIADTNATHISIATPYDNEFIPFMKRWVVQARKENLKVWFRGNFSGWEGWFGYPPITEVQHAEMLEDFILKNPYLFEDGDVFSPCPECENGGPGDPRVTKDVKEYRAFLIKELKIAEKSFKEINKKVRTNYSSMNFDVARLVMDEVTTNEMGGIVTIDHYVKDPEKLNEDINLIARLSKGKVILGEFGAPIPDIHGALNEAEQAYWIERALRLISTNKNLIGLNYWVNMGGTTGIWNNDGTKRLSVEIIKKYYTKSY